MAARPHERRNTRPSRRSIRSLSGRAMSVSALLVFAGTQWLALDVAGFGKANVLFVLLWLILAAVLWKKYQAIAAPRDSRM